MKKAILVSVLTLACLSAGGCAGLSLFSSTHVHHHRSEEIEKKIDSLEKRVEEIERAR